MTDFSFVILTYNEELQLPKFFESIRGLGAPVFVLDSGSTDQTISICEAHGAVTAFHPFENHPAQWHVALNRFDIRTPWIIGLDADQSLDAKLAAQLSAFRDSDHAGITGIFFTRKYYFKGKLLGFGGFQNFRLMKMFRAGIGYSDLNEHMDHRFLVPGKTIVWKSGNLIEENFKENQWSFWIAKHNRYSDLLAKEEIERRQLLRKQTVKRRFFGHPDERRALFKALWWKLPLYIRPFLYFTWRLIFRFGFLDGRTGILFHYMHAFWFRMLVDAKIRELSRRGGD